MRVGLAAIDLLNSLIGWVLAALLAVISVVVLLQVFVRFVLTALDAGVSAAWTEELARFLLCWMVFLGGAYGCRKAQLMSLDFAVSRLPGFLGQAARYVAILICLGFFLLLVQVGWAFAEFGRTESSPVMRLPMHWIYAAIPVGAAIMVLNTIGLMFEAWSRRVDIRTIGSETALD
jgi:TRAP-type C4-dicarboxylate transport system permease small subunit